MNSNLKDFINTIVCGDCLEVMKALPDSSVDLIISDYPFKFKYFKETAEEYYRLLKPVGNLVVVNNPHNMFVLIPYFQKFYLRNSIALIRLRSFYYAWHYGFKHNYCLILSKINNMKLKWNGTKTNHDHSFQTDVREYKNGYKLGKHFHPEALPEDLVKEWIEHLSNSGDIVLDPFMGSETTAVVCKELGRNFIGIEKNFEYVEMAKKRLSAISESLFKRQSVLFSEGGVL